MTATIAGIQIPDSTMAKDATALLREVATQLVYDHSRRVFLFASLRGQCSGDRGPRRAHLQDASAAPSGT